MRKPLGRLELFSARAALGVEGAVPLQYTARPAALAAIPLKDLLIAGVWVAGAFRTTILWRETRLRIGPGSVLTPIDPLDSLSAPLHSSLNREMRNAVSTLEVSA